MKKAFQLSVIAVALMASHAYAAPVWEGPTGTGTGLSNAMGGETNYANVPSTANGVILGQLNDVDNTSIGLGYNSNAMGKDSFSAGSANDATGDSSIALGRDTHVQANANNGIALGATVITEKAGGVALGNSQHVYDESGTAVGRGSVVAGQQASSLGHAAWTGGNGATAIGSETWANAENATTLGYNAETGGKNAVRVGAQSQGSGLNSIVIGSHATATTEDSIQLGSGGAGAAGIPGTSIADDKNSVAIGYGSDTQGQGASSENTVSVGGLLGGAIRRITQVTDGVDDKDAINVSQLNDAIAGLTSGAELITTADGLLTTEKEQRIAADTAAINAIVAEATARAAGDTALQSSLNDEAQKRANADAAQIVARTAAIDNEAQLRAAADATEKAARIAGDEAEKAARIAGDDAEKAARISAVNAEAQARIAGDAAEAAARADADLALTNRINTEAATRTSEVNRLDGRIDQASRRLDDIEKSAYRGVAIALAAQQAVPNIRSGQIALFAGVGHYEGETAGSVGVVTSFIANRVSLSGAVGFAGGNEVGGRIGLSYSF
ncbi:YadA-like family protein [Acinetobacter modestus]|uniref:YadA-like family protein n=1 Tax=Acinetobacter modestus TaxID=1776740 RepID=UPI001F4B0840|nr:YadA-like family protein [Acinetobacter modestus]MCH7386558.1 YadA-like family protein [Acinetobacter modestus]